MYWDSFTEDSAIRAAMSAEREVTSAGWPCNRLQLFCTLAEKGNSTASTSQRVQVPTLGWQVLCVIWVTCACLNWNAAEYVQTFTPRIVMIRSPAQVDGVCNDGHHGKTLEHNSSMRGKTRCKLLQNQWPSGCSLCAFCYSEAMCD